MITPTIDDLTRFADTAKQVAWLLVIHSPCCVLDVDGFPATALSGDESPEFIREFNEKFLPLVSAWRAAVALCKVTNEALYQNPESRATVWSDCLDQMASINLS